MDNGLIRNRKSIMALSGLMILAFHLWIYILQGNKVEMFMRTTAYVGVDIFFFLSAFSLGSRDVDDIPKFYRSRFISVYAKFALFVLIQAVLQKWAVTRVAGILTGVELMKKGGGSFLWFLPASMILYLAIPFYQKAYAKAPKVTVALSFGLWFAIGMAVTKLTNYRAIFIFWNRLPAYFLGFLCAKIPKKTVEKVNKPIIGVVLLVIGTLILWKFGFGYKLQKPIWNMFYVFGIPSTLGLLLLADQIPEIKVIKWIGSATLELYGMQMVFGYNIAGYLLKTTGNALIADVLTMIIVTALSIVVNQLLTKVIKKIK